MQHSGGKRCPEPFGKGNLHVQLGLQRMQDDRHVRPANRRPIVDLSCQHTDQIYCRNLGRRIVGRNDGDQRVHRQRMRRKRRVRLKAQLQISLARLDGSTGNRRGQRLKTDHRQLFAAIRVKNPRSDRITALLFVNQATAFGKGPEQGRQQGNGRVAVADNANHRPRDDQIGAGRSFTDHPLAIDRKRPIRRLDPIELAVKSLQ